ncbi:MAG: nuclear transport factor 2 family protein [Methanomassiliicoccales archaeon]|nr:nuclear transport factor 2 family protein [Methanomassiliicoccales archaeon]
MSEQENIGVVIKLLDAVGQGDMQAILDILAEDVEWQSPVTRAEHIGITWNRQRHGRDEVMDFFKELNQKSELEPFEEMKFIAQNDRVVLEGMNRGSARSTGKPYEHNWIMVFDIKGGRIVKHRHYYDTADIEPAFLKS